MLGRLAPGSEGRDFEGTETRRAERAGPASAPHLAGRLPVNERLRHSRAPLLNGSALSLRQPALLRTGLKVGTLGAKSDSTGIVHRFR